MINKQYMLAVALSILLQGCVAKNLSDSEVLGKAMSQCPSLEVSIIRIPSRGALADTMMAQSVRTTHNDGGFIRTFVQFVNSGSKNIVVECPSQQKLEAIIANGLNGIEDGKLKGISLCLIGISESEELAKQAMRTGVTLTMHK